MDSSNNIQVELNGLKQLSPLERLSYRGFMDKKEMCHSIKNFSARSAEGRSSSFENSFLGGNGFRLISHFTLMRYRLEIYRVGHTHS